MGLDLRRRFRFIRNYLIILICFITLLSVFSSNTSAALATVTMTFFYSDYTFQVEENEPANFSLYGRVNCESNARDVVVFLAVDSGGLSYAIEPDTIQFPRGPSEQTFSVNVVVPPGENVEYNFTVTVSGRYMYSPGPSATYNFPLTPAEVHITYDTSNEAMDHDLDLDTDNGSGGIDLLILVGVLVIIDITFAIVVIYFKKTRRME